MTSSKEVSLFDSMKATVSEPRDSQSGKARSTQEEEENLILIAWQSMQHSLCKDSTSPEVPQSFLAKQRQATQARRVFPAQLEPR